MWVLYVLVSWIGYFINPLMPNVFSHPYQLDEFISNSRVVRWYFHFYQIFIEDSVSILRRFAASDLVWQFMDARLICLG